MSHLNPIGNGLRSGLGRTRRLSVAIGVLIMLALAFVQEGNLAERLALAGLALFALATLAGWIQVFTAGQRLSPVQVRLQGGYSRHWQIAATVISVTAAVAVQTWFRRGTTVASGDITLPNGTAWLSRVFDPWTWSGSNALGRRACCCTPRRRRP